MRAAVINAPSSPFTIETVELEAPRAGEVVVRITHCGLCHSDLHVVDHGDANRMPVVVGHEAAGSIAEVGPGVTHLRVGDPVVLSPCPPCGRCYYCVRGEPSICVNSASISTGTLPDGTTRLSRAGETVYRGVGMGALAEYVIIPAEGAIAVPSDTPLDIACIIGCAVQTGVGAVHNIARVEPGATVLVLGLGGIGLSIVQGARIAGAARIIVSDPVAARREMGGQLGATDVIDPTTTDVSAEVRKLTGGIGVDYAFEAVGRSELVNTAIWASRNGGTTVMVGAQPLGDDVTITPSVLFMASQRKLLGSLLGGSNSQHEVLKLLALWRGGQLDLESMITARRPLDEVNAAADDMRAGRGVRTVLSIG